MGNSTSKIFKKRHQSSTSSSASGGSGFHRNSDKRSSAHEKATEDKVLSRREKRLVAKAWTLIKVTEPDFIKLVWFNVLNRSPKFCNIFGIPSNPKKEDAFRNAKFIRATAGVQKFFDTVIERFQLEEDKITGMSLDLGAKHCNYYARGFQVSNTYYISESRFLKI